MPSTSSSGTPSEELIFYILQYNTPPPTTPPTPAPAPTTTPTHTHTHQRPFSQRRGDGAHDGGGGRRRLSSASTSSRPSTPPSPATQRLEDLRHAFRVFDADGNGTISAAELARVLRGLGEAATVMQFRRIIEGVDQNGDGLISFEEFKVMMVGGGGFAKIAIPMSREGNKPVEFVSFMRRQ